MRKSIFVAVLVALILALGSGAATVHGNGKGKGGGGNMGGGGKTPPAVMVVTPDPADAYGGSYTITGSGFKAGQWVHMTEASPYCCSAHNVMADGSGSITYTRTTGYPGTYTITARQLDGRKYKVMAEVSFDVLD